LKKKKAPPGKKQKREGVYRESKRKRTRQPEPGEQKSPSRKKKRTGGGIKGTEKRKSPLPEERQRTEGG
jgi:hypothetical protein